MNMTKTLLTLRDSLVTITLEWEKQFGVAPSITSAISEYDAALLIGCSEPEYSIQRANITAVRSGHDFVFKDKLYQVKANRPSGKPGSTGTLVSNPKNDKWDCLIWILYDKGLVMQEAWLWDVESFRQNFQIGQRLSPSHIRQGHRLYEA